jgi:uncharacterized protein (DUF1499 family)
MLELAGYAATALLVLAALVVVAGQFGLLSGRMPDDLGVRDGRLKRPSATPNSVSSQAHLWTGPLPEGTAIDPLPAPRGRADALARLTTAVQAMPGARIVRAEGDYLYVQFTTRWLRFVDDAEFWFDPAQGVVQVRSASRVGRRDFGVNLQRIEALRAALAVRP